MSEQSSDKKDDETGRAYRETLAILNHSDSLSRDLSSIPSLVSLRDVIEHPLPSGDNNEEDEAHNNFLSLLTPGRGHMVLRLALEQLEHVQQQQTLMELALNLEPFVIRKLTETVTGDFQMSVEAARETLQQLGRSIPRRVCQHPFRRNDIVWVCRTCQADETCVLCHACYSQSNHEGHDVAFYHAQAGGCCDCGDPDAWDEKGFCPNHGPRPYNGNDEGLPHGTCQRVQGCVPSMCDWLVREIAPRALEAHRRCRARGLPPSVLVTLRSSTSDDVEIDSDPEDSDAMQEDSSQQQQQETSMNQDFDPALVDMGHVFVPGAASTSKSRHGVSATAQTETLAEQLGKLGREEHGLYLVLHADDIHTVEQLKDALRELLDGPSYSTEPLLGGLAKALRLFGQLVVWGTTEVLAELSPTQVHCWLDGDRVASTAVGAAMLRRASKLVQKHGLVCSIVSRKELQWEQRAVAAVQWLTHVARSCDPLCQTVAASVMPDEHLVPLLKADFQLGASIQKAWHSLLLTLLAVPTFKRHLSSAYCDTYQHVTNEYARGMGLMERSGYSLSVQFLNRVTYVVGLVAGRNLLGHLGKALLATLKVAAFPLEENGRQRLDPDHFVLAHRRYSPCISDLKCVLNVKGMARLFASRAGTFLEDWIQALSLSQCMDGQTWRYVSQGHVEVEPRGWVGAFNASISLGSLFERLLSWDDDDPSPVDASQTVIAQQLVGGVDLTYYVLTEGLARWQAGEMRYYTTVSGESPARECPASLPFSTVAARGGTHLALRALPIAQATAWSFHLPLHRFAAACLREVCRRPVQMGIVSLLERLQTHLPHVVHEDLFRGLMEFPLLVLTRSAQVQAGLWRRNGAAMRDQVLNYAEPPFCRALRDADILLVQFAALGGRSRDGQEIGCSVMVHLLLHRLGLFDYLGFANAPRSNAELYQKEVDAGLYPGEIEGALGTLPWSYSPATDVDVFLSLLEELLHLLVIIMSELPSPPPKDKSDHTKQAKKRLQREMVHRLASGPKTHSELSEVHHVLSHWDNTFLSEEGKMLNPDDASGAALGQALADVAEQQKSGRTKLSPEKWELKESAWSDYDPAFFHISLRSHQLASEQRPKPKKKSSLFEIEARAYSPLFTRAAHSTFLRLRRDITADATVLAIIYRTLHVHCRERRKHGDFQDSPDLRGALAYDSQGMSETALARAIHLLTLGASAWEDSRPGDAQWKQHGGGSTGSVFSSFRVDSKSPTATDWVEHALISDPCLLMDSECYRGEENSLLLLRRLATDGGKSGLFVAQDEAVRAGAAWLCDFAAKFNPGASALISDISGGVQTKPPARAGESDIERRRREAKERAIEKMKAEAARFAASMQLEEEEEEDTSMEKQPTEESSGESGSQRRRMISRSSTIESDQSGGTSNSPRSPQRGDLGIPQFFSLYSSGGEATMDADEAQIPERLLKQRPVCIICSEESIGERETDSGNRSDEDEDKRKRSRRKKERNNALAFVGYAQPSTVLVGGGGPPPSLDDTSALSTVRRFAGTHVALCSHAVHSECCESYLAAILQREDRLPGRREEFHCPQCKRLSNCLVPFIDVGIDWTDVPTCVSTDQKTENEGGVQTKPPARAGESDIERRRREAKERAIEKMKAEAARFAASMQLEEEEEEDTSMEKDQASMPLDDKSQTSPGDSQLSLHDFLSVSPWWVGRNDRSVLWNGQCAFISLNTVDEDALEDQTSAMEVDKAPSKNRFRRVRPLRKRDLYVAWNAMMRTPRFMRRRRRRLKASSNVADDSSSSAGVPNDPFRWAVHDESSSGETVVWRRFMDLLSEMAYRADSRRLGEEQHYLSHNCGEFRHNQVEKFAYNIENRSAGNETIDWPACISENVLPDLKRQELSREKLLSKLLMSIQSFTYSVCCESYEARRLLRKEVVPGTRQCGVGEADGAIKTILSRYGIRGVSCGGELLVMPIPSPQGEDSQPFDGRLGKLRHFGLSVAAAAGAVSADLVQLVLALPLEINGETSAKEKTASTDIDEPLRAPIAFPILLGHVLTHVVAAMCAACGWARARSDSLELAWPVPFSSRGSFYGSISEYDSDSGVDAVIRDCEGFIKIGFLARILQVLLSKMGVDVGGDPKINTALAKKLVSIARCEEFTDSLLTKAWYRSCLSLLQKALSREYLASDNMVLESNPMDNALLEQFHSACAAAAVAAVSFLTYAGVIFQVLVPGVAAKYEVSAQTVLPREEGCDVQQDLEVLSMLQEPLGLEPLEVMLRSSLVHDVVYNWLDTARSHARNADPNRSNNFTDSQVRRRLFHTEGFRCYDWPLASTRPYVESELNKKIPPSTARPGGRLQNETAAVPMQVDGVSSQTPPLVVFSPKKRVPLIGGYVEEASGPPRDFADPRISMLPTSYTDLYAELGSLHPDCEQVALCLICGEALNAGGKGECTRHSYKCGAGSCIFFLLQECLCLLMHGGKAVYEHSPYVDSHGETPQYRGRPLNLDVDRYDALKELWSGHLNRQKVINERGSARQQIIADFY